MLTMLTIGCTRSLDEVSVNPNRPTEVNPGNILTYISLDAFGPSYFGINRQLDNFFIDWRFGGSHLNWTRRSFTQEYRRLTLVSQMDAEAERTNLPIYSSIAKFFKAYWGFTLTRLYGDVPFSMANQMNDGVTNPKYDRQEDILYDVLNLLKEANTELSEYKGDTTIKGDVVYDGDVLKWRKLVNMLRLRVLINASLKEKIKDINIKDLFSEIVGNPTQYPIMTSLEDSPILYEDDNPDNYWLYGKNDFISGYRITQFTAEYMKDHEDTRLTVFAQPTIYAENKGLDPQNLDNYAGTNPWPSQSNNSNYPLEDSKKISRVNSRYYENTVGPPTMTMGYPEQEFILAEAAVRKWIKSDENVYFENGIKASYEFFGLSASKANDYLSNSDVVLSGSPSEKLDRIITEKYLNFYMQGGYEPYFDLRRTGYPDFASYVSPDISTLYNNGNLPLRYEYPLGEITDNLEEVTQAIDKLNGGDSIFSKMWLLTGQDELRNPSPFPYQ